MPTAVTANVGCPSRRFSQAWRSTRSMTAASKPTPRWNRNWRPLPIAEPDPPERAALERRRAAAWPRGRGGCGTPGCGRRRSSSRPGAAPARSSVPARPSAASFSVPSPPSTTTDVDAVARRGAGEPGGVTPPGGLGHLEVVPLAERLLDHHAPAGRHRRRGRVHDQRARARRGRLRGPAVAGRAVWSGGLGPTIPPWPDRPEPPGPAARGADGRDRRVPGVPAPRRVARAGRARRSARRSATRSTGAGRCPGFGDPRARLLIVGLAPAAHGGNRTGRVFTGDRSGDWLFASLHRAGFANQPTSGRARRRAACCATRTSPPPCAARRRRTSRRPRSATAACPYLVRELALLDRRARDRRARRVRVRGDVGARSALRASSCPRPGPRFAPRRSRCRRRRGTIVLGCYHPSQQNTFTGTLTEPHARRGVRRAAPG